MSTHNTWIEFEVKIDYDFQPEEKAVLYPNDSAYPGCPAEVTINSAELAGVDILDKISEDHLDRLRAEIMDELNSEY